MLKRITILAILFILLISGCGDSEHSVLNPEVPYVQSKVSILPWAEPLLSNEQIHFANQFKVPPAIEIDLGFDQKLKMVIIPSGRFMMGSPENEKGRDEDEGPQHLVTIKKRYYMSITEVTQAQWQAVMGENPSWFQIGRIYPDKDTSNYPVEQVSWEDAHKYISAINNKTKYNHFRLPSEAEWEYACRAWSTTRFYYGDDPKYDKLEHYAWYTRNVKGEPQPVGLKLPNKWGLYDMAGNISEIVEDDWPGDYSNQNDGKVWKSTPRNKSCVTRGGCWNSSANKLRSAFRIHYGKSSKYKHTGFRLVLDATSNVNKVEAENKNKDSGATQVVAPE